jgi:hypothetical protein
MENRKSENFDRVVHDKSDIGGGLRPIVAKPEGEVVYTYPLIGTE